MPIDRDRSAFTPYPTVDFTSSPTSLMDALSRALDEERRPCIEFSGAFDRHLGLRLRRSEVERWIIRHLPNARWGDDGALEAQRPDGPTRRKLLAFLSRVAARPLTGRLVAQTLLITNQERVRWTKDGRRRRLAQRESGEARSSAFRPTMSLRFPPWRISRIVSLNGEPKTSHKHIRISLYVLDRRRRRSSYGGCRGPRVVF